MFLTYFLYSWIHEKMCRSGKKCRLSWKNVCISHTFLLPFLFLFQTSILLRCTMTRKQHRKKRFYLACVSCFVIVPFITYKRRLLLTFTIDEPAIAHAVVLSFYVSPDSFISQWPRPRDRKIETIVLSISFSMTLTKRANKLRSLMDDVVRRYYTPYCFTRDGW